MSIRDILINGRGKKITHLDKSIENGQDPHVSIAGSSIISSMSFLVGNQEEGGNNSSKLAKARKNFTNVTTLGS